MSYGSLWQRLVRGVRWSWIDPRYEAALPPDLDASVMTLEQPRPAARQAGPLDGPGGVSFRGRRCRPVAVYLKRHFRLPWLARLAASSIRPGGTRRPRPNGRTWSVHGPGDARSGSGGDRRTHRPWTALQSYLMVAELTGCRELNVALPELAR